jgi:hypothetical protein
VHGKPQRTFVERRVRVGQQFVALSTPEDDGRRKSGGETVECDVGSGRCDHVTCTVVKDDRRNANEQPHFGAHFVAESGNDLTAVQSRVDFLHFVDRQYVRVVVQVSFHVKASVRNVDLLTCIHANISKASE